MPMSKLLKIVIPILLLLDLIYSFAQHYHTALDGDMAAIILPANFYQPVLNDPFGMSILMDGEKYGGAGRFFCHWSMSVYFKKVPLFLQHFLSPIDSVYFAAALIKTAIQIWLIWLLSAYISRSTYLRNQKFLLASLLVTPFFQTHGYSLYMGIVEKSSTYSFFYPLPLALLLLFFLPFFLNLLKEKNSLWYLLLFPLAIILPFSGPLIPAVVLMVCPVFLFFYWKLNEKIGVGKINNFLPGLPKYAFAALLTLLILSVYSFYLSRFNVENNVSSMPIFERYMALFAGLYKQLTQKIGLPLLLAAIFFNYWLINKKQENGNEKIKLILKCVGLFSVAYLMLLPLGGHRIYRAYIVRHDSMMPVTLGMVYMFGVSTLYLVKNIYQKYKIQYLAGIAVVLLIFTIADLPNFDHNACEKRSLHKLANADQDLILLEEECPVMAWGKITDPNKSWLNVQLLKQWQVIKSDKLYYQD